ncbi:MAG: MBL fold metallo-hydrolase [Candidatus Aenigmarchaeota archaeon]|nr:MBL fold metallo-hydrolase [Candidatus Aenigmarchaeota archaeon]
MKGILLILGITFVVFVSACVSPPTQPTKTDSSFTYKNVAIKWLGHAGFEISGPEKIYVDPFKINKSGTADFILLTHEHFDHCDPESVRKLQGKNTEIFGTLNCVKQFTGRINTLRPGEEARYPDGITITSVSAYNLNSSYHPKNFGRGFLVTVGNVTVYHAGDTDFIPEMENITADIALLPIGGLYTMDVEEAAAVARTIKPKIVVPMHYNSDAFGITNISADPEKLKELLNGTGIEVKILKY